MATFKRMLATAVLLLAAGPAGAAEELVADLSKSVVAITAGFVGSDLLLFGATDGRGDVVVVVRGPLRNEVVRRKKRVVGVWVNGPQVIFQDVPSFYAIAANRPLGEFLPDEVASINQIGTKHLQLQPHWKQEVVENYEAFRGALIRAKQRQGLYSHRLGNVIFLSSRLFRTQIHFPANVAVGTYGIDVYLIHDGEVASVKTTLLNVRKFGFEAGVFDFAHRHAMAYGVLAIFIAAMAGWLAGIVFRKA